jgi:hypothetical protein
MSEVIRCVEGKGLDVKWKKELSPISPDRS